MRRIISIHLWKIEHRPSVGARRGAGASQRAAAHPISRKECETQGLVARNFAALVRLVARCGNMARIRLRSQTPDTVRMAGRQIEFSDRERDAVARVELGPGP